MRRPHLPIVLVVLAALAAALTTLVIAAGPWTALVYATIGLILAAWWAAAGYAKRAYPLLPCRACHGSGKDFEPILLAWASLRLHRAWRDCGTCGGSGKRDRRGR